MTRSLPPLTWFRSFEAAARRLSFTLAAEEVGLTQSAVSQQVKALEDRLGVTLFVRRARGISLTDDGRKLLPQVGTALETLAQASGDIQARSDAGLLTVATSVSIAQWVISPALAEFKRAHPNVTLRILSTVWPDEFQASRADVQIRFGSRKQVGEDAELLRPDRLMPFKASSLDGALETLPLIETVGTSDGWRAWGVSHKMGSKPSLFSDTYGMSLQMAAHGSGVALVSELLGKSAMKTGLIARADDRSIAATEGYYLETRHKSDAATAFVSWLQDLITSA